MPVKRLLEINILCARCEGLTLSVPKRLSAAGHFLTILLVKVTSSIVDHGAVPLSFRTVNRIAGACLRIDPVVFEDVAIDYDSSRVFQFEKIFN